MICPNKVEISEIHVIKIWVSSFNYIIFNQILVILFYLFNGKTAIYSSAIKGV